ncbi:MAG: hypothetical protein AVDCRST_MAG41-2675, partial [uncultured Corynebacteriales bacterium]
AARDRRAARHRHAGAAAGRGGLRAGRRRRGGRDHVRGARLRRPARHHAGRQRLVRGRLPAQHRAGRGLGRRGRPGAAGRRPGRRRRGRPLRPGERPLSRLPVPGRPGLLGAADRVRPGQCGPGDPVVRPVRARGRRHHGQLGRRRDPAADRRGHRPGRPGLPLARRRDGPGDAAQGGGVPAADGQDLQVRPRADADRVPQVRPAGRPLVPLPVRRRHPVRDQRAAGRQPAVRGAGRLLPHPALGLRGEPHRRRPGPGRPGAARRPRPGRRPRADQPGEPRRRRAADLDVGRCPPVRVRRRRRPRRGGADRHPGGGPRRTAGGPRPAPRRLPHRRRPGHRRPGRRHRLLAALHPGQRRRPGGRPHRRLRAALGGPGGRRRHPADHLDHPDPDLPGRRGPGPQPL